MDMFVDPNLQSKGVGTSLIKDLTQEAGIKDITLAVLGANTRAIKFYEKQGFTEVNELKDTYLALKRNLMKRPSSIA